MKWFIWIVGICLFLVLSLGVLRPASANQPQQSAPCPSPVLPPTPGPASTDTRPAYTPAPADLDLPPLKAVLIVGPIDGNSGEWTTQARADMDLAAAELAANGVAVHTFYTPDNDWNTITRAAEGAHFLLYRGHGIRWSEMPSPEVGGFGLNNGNFVSPEDIRSDLKLAPGAIVMLYGCFTAGTSASDTDAISSTEAQRRVAQYADPFLEGGAEGYFANWFGNAFQHYIRALFAGDTLLQAYQSYYDFNTTTAEQYTLAAHPAYSMWLDYDVWTFTKYNNAFVGDPDATLQSLFGEDSATALPDDNSQRGARTIYLPAIATGR